MKNAHMRIAMSAMYAVGALLAGAAEVKVDFSTEIGPVKPVNGVGQSPLVEKIAGIDPFDGCDFGRKTA